MNFFKSIITDDQEAPTSESDPDSPGGVSNPNDADDAWSFGGFVRSFSMQSESVIEAYRRDLQEFGSGLKKETEILRETASRAVKDLPASLEAAQGAIDVVLKSTASMINKEALGFSSDGESEMPGTNRSLNSGRYSRFEAQLIAIQSDLNTFCMEPEDAEDYGKWKLGFELGDYEDAIEGLIGENGIMEGIYGKAVPNAVDQDTFWCRYFYRVEKLKQQEKMRASIVKMAISNDDDEDLSWDVDDDDDVASDGKSKGKTEAVDGEKVELSEKSGVHEREGKSGTVDEDGNDEKVGVEKKGEEVVVSNQEEDLGWDEIGDIGSGHERKTSAAHGGGNPKKDDLRKPLAVEEDDDDDLNWGIEDDDEPVKA
ncbi:uncharacterized protein LOC131000584 [Salvia miltiorrhiza]|uniref:uncharacterized protein LOC131000584 n=1 Tax=Salvia miltiorrhiza TaxID=226208 RepID=UPI0025AD6CEF|nr:uncharacterized protein LOC131000584 [Salvia miltiorrhiza]